MLNNNPQMVLFSECQGVTSWKTENIDIDEMLDIEFSYSQLHVES